MAKRTGQPNSPISPWKSKVKESRREAAALRQAVYDAKPLKEKLLYCGAKERAKLLAKAESAKVTIK